MHAMHSTVREGKKFNTVQRKIFEGCKFLGLRCFPSKRKAKINRRLWAASIKRNGMKNGTENGTRFIVMNNVIMIIMGVILMFIEKNI